MLTESLSLAFDRIDDFLAVQSPGIELEKLKLLQEVAGISNAERRTIVERLEALARNGEHPQRGAVLLGLMLGIFAAQFEGAGSL